MSRRAPYVQLPVPVTIGMRFKIYRFHDVTKNIREDAFPQAF
jgi:hypothetical protein